MSRSLAWPECVVFCACAMVVGVCGIVLGQTTVTFTGVGVLSGDATSGAYSVSRDGAAVTGASVDGSGNAEAFIYTTNTGAKTGIGFPSGWTATSGEGVDRETTSGSVYVAGTGKNASGNEQAFFYDATAAAFTAIPFLSGGLSSKGHAIQRHFNSSLLVVGRSDRIGPTDSKYHAFRWRNTDGDLEDLGETETDSGDDGNRGEAFCLGVRPNGAHVVRGSADTGYPSGGNNPVAFSWYSGDSFNYCLWWADLTEPNPRNSNVRGTSADGRYLTGTSTFETSICESNREAYLYDSDDKDLDVSCNYPGGHYKSLQYCVVPDGAGGSSCIWGSTMLGSLVGHEGRSEGTGVSLDGQVVVGWARKLESNCTWGEADSVAFIWDQANGIRDLKAVLEGYGLDLTGWVLTEARSVSSDGTVICGLGTHDGVAEGWVATIGRTGSIGACCKADLSCEETDLPSCDGMFNPGVTCAETVCCHRPFADSDGDGDVDQDDFGAFQICYTGPGGGVPTGCECFNREGNDTDVDGNDFLEFSYCWTGPNVPWTLAGTPQCQP